jgi:hypothetical protein
MGSVLVVMKPRYCTAAIALAAFTGVLTARAADSQLLSLLPPDSKVIAGVNVDAAKSSPFGLWVISQMQNNAQQIQQFTVLTGFDPTRDVHEILAASNAASHSGLVAARGNFDSAKLTAAASLGGAQTESYGGYTILEDSKQQGGVAFLDSTVAVAGDLPSVKAAIDRQRAPQPLPSAVVNMVNQWSAAQDAWAISTVPPASLHPAEGTPAIPGIGGNAQGILQKILQLAGGVKLGSTVAVTAQAMVDNAPNATQIAATLQLLANLAQTQASQKPEIAALVQGLAINANGSAVNVTLSLPQAQIQQFLKQADGKLPGAAHAPVVRKKGQ